jgi:hypothetical protein
MTALCYNDISSTKYQTVPTNFSLMGETTLVTSTPSWLLDASEPPSFSPVPVVDKQKCLDIVSKHFPHWFTIPDDFGNLPIHHIFQYFYSLKIPTEISHNLDVSAQNSDGNTPLHCTLMPKLFELDQVKNASVQLLNTKNKLQQTPLFTVGRMSDDSWVDYWLKEGVELNGKDVFGNAIIHTAVHFLKVEQYKKFLESKLFTNGFLMIF